MKTQCEPVETIDDVSASWMTAALEQAGLNCVVSEVSSQPIGTGQMADSFRVNLTFDSHDASQELPRSLVIKMQAEDVLSRQAGAGGAYSSEIRFYTELAPTVSIRTPHCYLAIGPDDTGRFALILEDMAPAEQGDQLLGCDVESARRAVINLAGLHGPRWCDPGLYDVVPHRSADELAYMADVVAEFTTGFIAHYGDRVSPEDRLVLQAFAPECGRWLSSHRDRFVPVHGDYRLDNLLFGRNDAGDIEVSAVDWQTLDLGLPGRDLGYFLGNSLMPVDRRASETELVGVYHDTLLGYGVKDYSLEQCFDDYRYGQFQGLMITVLAAVGLAHTERGDNMFMVMSSRACEAIRDLDSLALL